MKSHAFIGPVLVAAILVLAGGALAGAPVPVPPPFELAALKDAVTALQTTVSALQADNATQQAAISALQSEVATLQTQLATLNASPVMALNPYLTLTTTGGLARATFHSLNIQLVNGTGYTGIPNGVGNLIIGYDTLRSDGTDDKTGSHYLVVGDQHNYSQYGGIVVGYHNTSDGFYASVSGGGWNSASGAGASVSGGLNNEARGSYASVSGGGWNFVYPSTAGSVSGGYNNATSADYASVSGGTGHAATDQYDWRAGSLFQDN
jgi:hypothetical protein